MKEINFGAAVGIIANLGVIGGLVFLGYEVRQNTAQMRAEASYAIHQDIQRMNESVYGSRAFSELLIKADEQYESLDAADKQRVRAFYFSEINLADLIMGLEKEGLSDVIFRTEELIIDVFQTSPGRRAFIETVYKPLSAKGSALRSEKLHHRLVADPNIEID